MPADGLLLQRLPADKNIVGCLAFEDQFELVLELSGFEQTVVGATFLVGHRLLLLFDPVFQHGVGELFQQLVVELVVIDQGAEAVFAAIPNLPLADKTKKE